MSFDQVQVRGLAIDNLEDLGVGDAPQGHVTQVRGEEQLSGAFRYIVRYEYNPKDAPDFSDVVNKRIRLTFTQTMNDDQGGRHQGDRTKEGIVTTIRQHGQGARESSQKLSTTSYLIEIRSVLWRLHLERRNHTYEGRPVASESGDGGNGGNNGGNNGGGNNTNDGNGKASKKGIINKIIEDRHGLALDTSGLKHKHALKKQTAVHQTGETDLEFIDRLAREVGVVYYVPSSTTVNARKGKESEGNGYKIKLIDTNSKYEWYSRCSERDGTTTSALRSVKGTMFQGKEGVLDSYSYEHNIIPKNTAAVSVDHNDGQVRREMTGNSTNGNQDNGQGNASNGQGEDTYGTVWEPSALTGYVESSMKEVWGILSNQNSPDLARTRGAQLQSAKTVLRGHTQSHLLGAGMRFTLDSQSCDNALLDHFDENGDPEFIVGRILVSTNRVQTGRQKKEKSESDQNQNEQEQYEKTFSVTVNVEFEAIPNPSNQPSYRGDQYARRHADAAGGTHLKNRFDVFAEKYSALQDTTKELANFVAVKDSPKMRENMGKKKKKRIKKNFPKALKNLPPGAEGLEAIDPYAMSVEATARPPTSSPDPEPTPPPPPPKPEGPKLYTAKVTGTPPDGSEKAKQGRVQVKLDLDEGTSDPLWARVLSFWSGNDWGAQFLPRTDTRVLVISSKDGNDQHFVVGSLYEGNAPMPHPEDPTRKSAIRGRSQRKKKNIGKDDDKVVHNEIMMKDKSIKEEIRIMAPTYRTDVSGLGKDVKEEKRTYYELDLSNYDGLDRSRLTPYPKEYIIKDKKDDLKSAHDNDLCEIRPWIMEMEKETELTINSEDRISLVLWYGKDKKTKLHVKDSLKKFVSNKIDDVTDIEGYIEMPQMCYLNRKYLEHTSYVDGWNDNPSLGEIPAPKKMNVEKWQDMREKVKFVVSYPSGFGSGDLEGFDKLKKKSKKVHKKNKNKDWHDNKYEVIIKKLGRDAYDKSDIEPYKEAYDSMIPGKDAYLVPPFKEAYPDSIKRGVLFHGDRARAEYTEGSALEACQGTYQIHTFGDRVEIYRGSESNGDVFDQEFTKEWNIDSLPGELERFGTGEDKPIMILSKDGSVDIRSKKGINIESKGDINIQSGGTISMYAEERISEEAEKEHKTESKNISIEGNMSHGKIEVVAAEIEIGTYPATKEVKLEGKKVEKHSDHHYETRTGITVKKESYVASLANIHDAAAGMHNIQTAMGTKAAAIETATVAIGNKNVVIADVKNALTDFKNVVLDDATKAVDVKTDAIKENTGGITSLLKALSSYI